MKSGELYLRERMIEALTEWNKSGDASQCGKILEKAINAKLVATGVCRSHGRVLVYSVNGLPWRCHCGKNTSDQRVMPREEFRAEREKRERRIHSYS